MHQGHANDFNGCNKMKLPMMSALVLRVGPYCVSHLDMWAQRPFPISATAAKGASAQLSVCQRAPIQQPHTTEKSTGCVRFIDKVVVHIRKIMARGFALLCMFAFCLCADCVSWVGSTHLRNKLRGLAVKTPKWLTGSDSFFVLIYRRARAAKHARQRRTFGR